MAKKKVSTVVFQDSLWIMGLFSMGRKHIARFGFKRQSSSRRTPQFSCLFRSEEMYCLGVFFKSYKRTAKGTQQGATTCCITIDKFIKFTMTNGHSLALGANGWVADAFWRLLGQVSLCPSWSRSVLPDDSLLACEYPFVLVDLINLSMVMHEVVAPPCVFFAVCLKDFLVGWGLHAWIA